MSISRIFRTPHADAWLLVVGAAGVIGCAGGGMAADERAATCSAGIEPRAALLRELDPASDGLPLARALISGGDTVLVLSQREDTDARPGVQVYLSGSGLLPPLPASGDVVAPVPILLDGDAWGVLWGSRARAGAPSPPNRLSMSRWTGDGGWSIPVTLARSELMIDWPDGVTIRRLADRSTALMVPVQLTARDRAILFGRVSGSLEPLPLPPDVIPYGATFIAGHAMQALVQFGPTSADPDVPAVWTALSMTTEGVPSRAVSVGFPAGYAYRSELLAQGDSVLNLLWADGPYDFRHATMAAGVWEEHPLADQWRELQLFGNVAGLSRDGRLVLIREALAPGAEARLATTCFDGGWHDPTELPFTGIDITRVESADDRLRVVFSGAPLDGDKIGVWLLEF